MSATTRISQVFQKLKEKNEQAFMPFVTAGDPGLEATAQLIRTLGDAGADLIELGFPYSDPIADGPVIQASYTRSLNKGIKVDAIFDMLKTLPTAELPPIVGMVSFAIIMKIGITQFLDKVTASGMSGLIIPDLPTEEAEFLKNKCQAVNVDLIQLLAPTSSQSRARKIISNSTGFIYCIAVAGITGVREQVADELFGQLRWLKQETRLPLAVGFGISKPEHVVPLKGLADGIIVGSAIVKKIEEATEQLNIRPEGLTAISSYIKDMKQACSSQL